MPRTLYALLVAIDRYRSPVPPLNGCVNDIDAVAELLRDLGTGGDFELNVRVLRDAKATRAEIIDGFRNHLCKAGSDDVALFYYSGHGSQEDAPPEFWHLEPDRLDETLVCYDSRDEGQWDLADKELSALIAEVAKPGSHVLCVLDCCHSGSGTRAPLEEGIAVRRAPTDRRRRPVEAFLDGTLAAQLERSDDVSDSGWGILPTGKHLLLAACRPSETAKEVIEAGTAHGAFTAALLTALRQTGGAITYRDLLKRAEAQVRLRVAQQVPQVEVSDPDDLMRPFLGGAVQRQRAHFTLRYDRELGWVIDGGAVHGIPRPAGGEKTVLAVFALGAGPDVWRKLEDALATAVVEEIRPHLSRVTLETRGAALDQQATYRCIVIAMPLPAMGVHMTGDSAALDLVRQALATAGEGGKPSLLVREARADEQARLRIDVAENKYRVSHATAERPLVAEVEGITPTNTKLLVERLEHVARWEAVAGLENPGSRLDANSIEIAILRPIQDAAGKEVWEEADSRRSLRLEYAYADGRWQRPRLRIELTNKSKQNVYCALLWLGEDYSINSSLLAGGTEFIPAGKSVAAHGGKDLYGFVPDAKWREGRTEVRDVLKLIVSTEQFDPRLFDQEEIDYYVRDLGTRGTGKSLQGTLERLAARVHSRGLSTEPEEGEINADWAARELALTVVRPLEATEVPSVGEQGIGAGVTLMGHPALKAKARLVSPTEVGRSLEDLSLPAILRDDPEASQPFLFEAPRGTDPGLGALQLVDVDNPEAVTADAPLVLRVEAHVRPHEHILPFAWDGEFFLPLGVARPVDGGIEIEVRQLPAPLQTTRDVERGIVSSVRILFQKILGSTIGTAYDYPRLAAVSFDANGNATYDATKDAVRKKVAQASRVLLYVHGILGDTLGMAASSRAEVALLNGPPQRIGDQYDLVLAFDYENINTGIKDTAKALKERLAAVGLHPGHDKTLHVVAHSMGGLVSRWFIEREGGAEVVQHLVTLGTPHAGSPWPTIQGWATAAVAIGLNGLAQVAWPVKLLGDLVSAIETVDVMLDEMAPGSSILTDLAKSECPNVWYTLLAGNTSIIPAAATSGRLESLLSRLSPQKVLHTSTALVFLKAPNDIAVSVESAKAVPASVVPKSRVAEVGCDHVTFFSSNAGREALLNALGGKELSSFDGTHNAAIK